MDTVEEYLFYEEEEPRLEKKRPYNAIIQKSPKQVPSSRLCTIVKDKVPEVDKLQQNHQLFASIVLLLWLFLIIFFF
ncbi:hypothetical protein SNE40_007363 [Patella caerulea]|uniref:Uncharacterized protein n=1 Tax=Patella caerulea TaxID=87958 RepID=A0AAN8JWK4_PATCE